MMKVNIFKPLLWTLNIWINPSHVFFAEEFTLLNMNSGVFFELKAM